MNKAVIRMVLTVSLLLFYNIPAAIGSLYFSDGFEQTGSNWSTHRGNGHSIATDKAHKGLHSLKIESDGTPFIQKQVKLSADSSRYGRWTVYRMNVTASETITMSFYVSAEIERGEVGCGVSYYDDHEYLHRYNQDIMPLTSSVPGWKKVSVSFDVPEEAKYGYFSLQTRDLSGRVWFDDVVISSKAIDKAKTANKPKEIVQAKQITLAKIFPLNKLPMALTVPLLTTPIKIDGIIGKQEWQASARLCGFLDTKAVRTPSSDFSWIATDGKMLYIAVQASLKDFKAGEKLKAEITERDGYGLWADDSVEVLFTPVRNSSRFQLIVNSKDVMLDTEHRMVGGHNTKWDAKAIVKSRVTKKFWNLEMAIPLTAMGDLNEGLLLNIWRTMRGQHSSLTGTANAHTRSKMMHLSWATDCPALKFDSWGNLVIGDIDLAIAANQTGSRQQQLQAELNIDKTQLKFDWMTGKTGETDKVLPIQTTPFKFDLQIKTASRKIFSQQGELKTGLNRKGTRPATATKVLGKMAMLYLRHYQGFGKVGVEIVSLPDSEKITKAVIDVTDPNGLKTKFTIHPVSADVLRGASTLPSQINGNWKIGVTLYNQQGKAVFAQQDVAAFKRRSWEWEGNQLGISDKVIPPFIPIKVKGNKVSLLLRDYTLNNLGLPTSIITEGDEILAAPISLNIELENGKLLSDVKMGSLKFIKQNDTEVIAQGKGQMGNIAVSSEVTIEYDGFMWLKISVDAKNEIKIKRIYLDIPLKKEYASLLHSIRNGVLSNPSGAIPAGEGTVWDSSKVPEVITYNKSYFPTAFVPYIWFGESKKGICWFAENDRGYNLAKKIPALTIKRNNNRVALDVAIINRPTTLTGKRTFAFGLMATPVKNRQKGWRKFIHGSTDTIPGMTRVMRRGGIFGVGRTRNADKYPTNHDYGFWKALTKAKNQRKIDHQAVEAWRKRVNPIRDARITKYGDQMNRFMPWILKGAPVTVSFFSNEMAKSEKWTLNRMLNYDLIALYFDPRTETEWNPEFQYFGPEWEAVNKMRDSYNFRRYVFPVQSLIDYQLWYYKKYLESGFDSIHFDNLYLMPSNDPDIELGFYGDDGKLHASMGILGTRKIMRRVATLMYNMGIKPHINLHISNTFVIPYTSFATCFEDWEYEDDKEFPEKHPPDFVRTESTGLQSGLYCAGRQSSMVPTKSYKSREAWLDERARLTRTAMSLTLLHDMTMDEYPWNQKGWAIFVRAYGVKHKFKVYEDDCTFVPYWEKGFPVELEKDFKASFYARKGRALMFIANFGGTGKTGVNISTGKYDYLNKLPMFQIIIDHESLKLKELKRPLSLFLKRNDFATIYFGTREEAEALIKLNHIKYINAEEKPTD